MKKSEVIRYAMLGALEEWDRERTLLIENPHDENQRERFNRMNDKINELRSMQMKATLEEL